VNKCAAKLFLFLFVNLNIFALPGMSTVSYDFSLNSEVFSQAAINCQTRPTADVGLERIAEFMNQMNCNKLTDPEKFCKCVSAISNKGLSISEKESVKIDLMIDKVSERKVLESIAGSIEDLDEYKDLVDILSSENIVPKCLITDNPNDSLFGSFQRKQRRGELLTTKDKLALSIYDKIYSDIKNNTNKMSLESVLSDASYVKDLASKVGYKPSMKVNLLQKDTYDISNIDWDRIEETPVIRLLKKDENLSHLITQSMQSNYTEKKLPFASSSPKVQIGGVANIYQKQKFYGSDGYDTMMVDSAVVSACGRVRSAIDKLIRKSDVEKSVRSIKAAAFNPVSDDEKATFKIIEKDIATKLGNSESIEERRRGQEFIFNMDILYCKNRELDSGKTAENNVVKDLKRDVLVISTKLEMAKKDKERDYNLFIKSNNDFKEHIKLEEDKKEKIKLLKDIVAGKYAVEGEGAESIDIGDDELYELSLTYAPNLAVMIEHSRKYGSEINLTYDDIKNVIARDEQELKHIKSESGAVKEKFTTADQKYRGSAELVRQLEISQKGVIAKLEKAVGSSSALAIVAKTQKQIDDELGLKSGYDLVLENEQRKEERGTSKKSRAERFSNEVLSIATSINESHIEPTATPALSNTESVISNKDPVQVTAEVAPSNDYSAPSNVSVSNRFTNNMVVGKKDIPSQVKKAVETKKTVKQSESNELENKIRELEELMSQNEEASTPEESSSIDNKIAELKEKINIEKIRSEKLKITKELNDLKVSKTKENVTDSAVAQAKTSSSPLANYVSSKSSRSPSSVSRSSGHSSGSGVSTASSSSNFAPSTSSSPTSIAGNETAKGVSESRSETGGNSNFDKSSIVSLDSALGNNLSKKLEIVTFQGDIKDLDTRLVKVDFNLSSEDIANQEEVLESLFVEGEDEIVILTLEGEKIIVKNKLKEEKKLKNKNEDIKRKNKKMRHQNLIDLLKVGHSPVPL